MKSWRDVANKAVNYYLDCIMHAATSAAIVQVAFDWLSTPEYRLFPVLQNPWITRVLFVLFAGELLLRTVYVPDWSRVRGLRARTRWERFRNGARETWLVLRTQVFDRWYLIDVVALVSFINFERLRLLRGLRTTRAAARWVRLTRLARVAKQMRPRVRSIVPRIPGGPYAWLLLGNVAVLVAAALVVSAFEQCTFGKALSWTAQVFYSGESFWTTLADPRARAFGDLVKIPGMIFYALLIALLPDMIQRGQRLFRAIWGVRNHYVVFGWNEHAYRLLRNLINWRPTVQRRTLVVDDIEQPDHLKELGVQYLRGPLLSLVTLERASVHSAHAVIVPPSRRTLSHERDLDGATFLLASHMATTSGDRNASRLVACTESPETHDSVERLGGTAVDTCRLGGRLLSRALLRPGIERVVQGLLAFTGANVFIEPVPRRWASRTFLELNQVSCAERVRPLGVVRDRAVVLIPDAETAARPLRESEAIIYISDAPRTINLSVRGPKAAICPVGPNLWASPADEAEWSGRKVLVVGWNAQMSWVVQSLLAVPAEIQVAVKTQEARSQIALLGDRVVVGVGPTDDPAFLKPWVADESLAGVLLLADVTARDPHTIADYQVGMILLQIRELERKLGLPRRRIVVETSSVADHARLRHLDSLYAPTLAAGAPELPQEDLGLVCVEELCGLLVAQATTTRRIVEVFESILNAAAGCDLDSMIFQSARDDMAFSDITHAIAADFSKTRSVPIAILRGAGTLLNPAPLSRLQRADRIVCLRGTARPTR